MSDNQGILIIWHLRRVPPVPEEYPQYQMFRSLPEEIVFHSVKEAHDDPEPACEADIEMEYCPVKLYSPSAEALTKNCLYQIRLM
jgi:hypothetical protein